VPARFRVAGTPTLRRAPREIRGAGRRSTTEKTASVDGGPGCAPTHTVAGRGPARTHPRRRYLTRARPAPSSPRTPPPPAAVCPGRALPTNTGTGSLARPAAAEFLIGHRRPPGHHLATRRTAKGHPVHPHTTVRPTTTVPMHSHTHQTGTPTPQELQRSLALGNAFLRSARRADPTPRVHPRTDAERLRPWVRSSY